MFERGAEFYDLFKSQRDYGTQSLELRSILNSIPPGNSLLEVACGTGKLLYELSEFERVGVDGSPAMLAVADRRLPTVRLVCADMKSFTLGRTFDVVLCLDGAIGYNHDLQELRATLSRIRMHLRPGGLTIIEPWYSRDTWQWGTPHYVLRLPDDLDPHLVFRLSTGEKDGTITFHHLVTDGQTSEYFIEKATFGLFSELDLTSALADLGFVAIEKCVPTAVFNRGLFTARAP